MKDIKIKLEVCRCKYCGSYNISANDYMAVFGDMMKPKGDLK